LTLTINAVGTLVLVIQSPEADVSVPSAKALLHFAEDEDDGPEQIRALGGLEVLVRLLTHEEPEFASNDVTTLAVCARDEVCRLKTVELEGLKPMVGLLGSEDVDVQAKAAFALSCHAIDPPVRLSILELGGIKALVQLLTSDDKDVLKNACLALTCCAKHPQVKDEIYKLMGVKLLIELLGSSYEEVQEHAANALAYTVETEENRKDFRRLQGMEVLIENLSSTFPRVQQAAAFCMSSLAFDYECRRECRSKDGLRVLAHLLGHDDAKVQEQAMMALANCALDVPSKQAIGVLGGMRHVVGLLSSPDPPVQANACIAVSRLVYNFTSGLEYNDQDGSNYLNDILTSYIAACKQHEDKLVEQETKMAAYHEQVQAAKAEGKEPPEPPMIEELEEPDHHLAKCALDAVVSTSEQGEVRTEIRQKEGMLEKLRELMEAKSEAVRDGAATALANCSYDVDTRPMLVKINCIPSFMKAADSDSVDGQLAAARALGNFALDDLGRAKIGEANGNAVLVSLLKAKSIETRRQAIMALLQCARDRDAAVEVCDLGGLQDLIDMCDTHWKQLGVIAKDAYERLLDQNLSAKFWYTGELQFTDKTVHGFFDIGIGRQYRSLKELQADEVESGHEVLVADMTQDKRLEQMVENARKAAAAAPDKGKVISSLSALVAQSYGGACSYEAYQDFGCATEVHKCKLLRKTNAIWIGDLQKGACRHRAFVFKYICDQIGIECRLHRARHIRGAHVGHAWNSVYLNDDTPYVVDLMHEVGAVFPDGSTEARRYARFDMFAFVALR